MRTLRPKAKPIDKAKARKDLEVATAAYLAHGGKINKPASPVTEAQIETATAVLQKMGLI